MIQFYKLKETDKIETSINMRKHFSTLFLVTYILILFSMKAHCQTIQVIYQKGKKLQNEVFNSIHNFSKPYNYNINKIAISKKTTIPPEEINNQTFTIAIGNKATKLAITSQCSGLFLLVFNVDKAGLIDDFGMPTTQFTGIHIDISFSDQMNVIKQILKSNNKGALIISDDKINRFTTYLANLNQEISLHLLPFNKKINFLDNFTNVTNQYDFFLSTMDHKIYNPKTILSIIKFALKSKKPFFGFSAPMTKSGAMMSFYCDFKALGKQAMEITEKCLNGIDTKTIPIQYPKKFHYDINKNIAKHLHIKLPKQVKKNAYKIL